MLQTGFSPAAFYIQKQPVLFSQHRLSYTDCSFFHTSDSRKTETGLFHLHASDCAVRRIVIGFAERFIGSDLEVIGLAAFQL